MKKKFNPSAALGYKRIKPLYDKAVSDLVGSQRTIDAQRERMEDQFCQMALLDAKVDKQKGKLKSAGMLVGAIIRERDAAIKLAEQHKQVLVESQKDALKRHEGIHRQLSAAMDDVRSLRGTQSTLDKQLDSLRHIVATQKCARAKAERERDAALADVRELKEGKRNWAIFAGALVGGAVAALVKLIEMGAF